jgi:hypothetical protein
MKVRTNFVSNSSSSSFTVPKANLNPIQEAVCRNQKTAARFVKKMAGNLDREVGWHLDYDDQEWTMSDNDTEFHFSTFMDNFDLVYLFKQFDIPMENFGS